jgi:hypothetical protein
MGHLIDFRVLYLPQAVAFRGDMRERHAADDRGGWDAARMACADWLSEQGEWLLAKVWGHFWRLAGTVRGEKVYRDTWDTALPRATHFEDDLAESGRRLINYGARVAHPLFHMEPGTAKLLPQDSLRHRFLTFTWQPKRLTNYWSDQGAHPNGFYALFDTEDKTVYR